MVQTHRVLGSHILAICCWCGLSAFVFAQPIANEEQGVSKSESAIIALDSVIANLPQWSSKTGIKSFHFEVSTFLIPPVEGVGKRSVSRAICDHRPGADVVFFEHDMKPAFLCSNDTIYEYLRGDWCRRDLTWTFQLKNPSPSEAFGEDRSQFPEGPIVVDIPHFLSSGLDEQNCEIRHERITNSHIIVKENKSWIEIRMRSPSDTELLGCQLSEVLIVPKRVDRGMPHGCMSIRSFVAKEELGMRMHLSKGYMEAAVQPGPAPDEVTRSLKTSPLTAWFAVFPELLAHQEMGKPLDRAFQRLFAPYADPNVTDQARWTRLHPLVDAIVTEIRKIQQISLIVFRNNEALTIDDPAIRWRQNERRGWRSMSDLSTAFMALMLINAREDNHDTIYSCFDAVADFGTPINATEYTLSRPNLTQFMPGQELFIETIFRSRHMYHVEPEEIDATVAALVYSKPGSEMERVAVETLLRLDEHDRVPPECWQRWWDKEVVKADKLFRWDTLSMLSLHPGNRAVLIEQLPKAAAPLHREIYVNLKLRAESTQRTQRWDFMTEAECEQILALPAPPTPGKDTEGGPARPFPTDE